MVAICCKGDTPFRRRRKLTAKIQNWPTVKARLVSTMNFVKSRRETKWSCGQSIGKSWRQRGWSSIAPPSGRETLSWLIGIIVLLIHSFHQHVQRNLFAAGVLVHRRRHIDVFRSTAPRRHHVDPGRDGLRAKLKTICGRRARTQRFDLLPGAEEKRLAGTDRGTHGLETFRG